MRHSIGIIGIVLVSLSLAAPALAGPDFKCKGNRVEKSGSTKYTIRHSGDDFTVEKSNSTKGKAVKRGEKFTVEVSNSTKATIKNGKIYKNNSTWATVADAKKTFDCPDTVAATLWVLTELGLL